MKTYCIIFNEAEKDSLSSALSTEKTRLEGLIDKIEEADVLDDDKDDLAWKIQSVMAEHVAEVMKKATIQSAKLTQEKPAPIPAPVADNIPRKKTAGTPYKTYDREQAEADGLDPLNPWDADEGEWRCCGSRHHIRHLNGCVLNSSDGKLPPDDPEPTAETAKDPRLERFSAPMPHRRFATKPCCGSNGPHHKSDCETQAKPAEDNEEAEEVENVQRTPLKRGEARGEVLRLHAEGKTNIQIAEEIGCSRERVRQIVTEQGLEPNSAAVAAAPKEATESAGGETEGDEEDEDEGTEDQEFICKECGNTRIEPHGTKALLLSCPNGWAENPEKHVYELKIEE